MTRAARKNTRRNVLIRQVFFRRSCRVRNRTITKRSGGVLLFSCSSWKSVLPEVAPQAFNRLEAKAVLMFFQFCFCFETKNNLSNWFHIVTALLLLEVRAELLARFLCSRCFQLLLHRQKPWQKWSGNGEKHQSRRIDLYWRLLIIEVRRSGNGGQTDHERTNIIPFPPPHIIKKLTTKWAQRWCSLNTVFAFVGAKRS